MKMKNTALKSVAFTLCSALALTGVPSLYSQSAISANASAEDEYYLKGDVVNNDGITTLDALAVQEYEAKLRDFNEQELLSADTNADGSVGIADAVEIMIWVLNQNNQTHTGEYYYNGTNQASVYDSSSFSTDGWSASFTHNAETAGKYKVRIKYSSDLSQDIIKDVVANNSDKAYAVSFNKDQNEAIIVMELGEGLNTISIENPESSSSDYALPKIDSIEVARTVNKVTESHSRTPVQTSSPQQTTVTTEKPAETATTTTAVIEVPNTPVRYYASEADFYDGWKENTNAGFEGTEYINYNNAIGSYVNWSVNVPVSGNYAVTFRYSNGTATNRPCKIMVNGEHKEAYYQDFNGTGTWTDWKTATVVLELKEGKNTIKARATTTGGGPNMDYIELVKTDDPAVKLSASTDGKIMENLNRGVSSAHAKNGNLVSWRHLADDNENTTFNLWRIRSDTDHTMLGTFTMSDASAYFDSEGLATDSYTIDTYVGDKCTEFAQFSVNLPNTNSGVSGAYFDIPTQKPADQTMPDGTTCSYTENDCSVGDVDGDGQYEVIVKWDPSNSQDNSKNGYTGTVILDCYKLDGTLLWRIDLGKNIRAGAHYTQYMVYDFDKDGKAELICKTADGTKDNAGNYVGDKNKDYRSTAGRILEGPEYLTLFDGATGKILDTVDYKPGRGDFTAWGDNYGNRVDRFVACVAYLDGETPSAVFGRGYYTRVAHTAYNVVGKKLKEVWAFDTGNNSSVAGYGDGNHHSMGADVDGDGKDEVIYGSGVIDDNGKLLYTTGLAHGDAIHIGDFDPSNYGLEIFQCLEDETHPNGTAINFGTILRDAKTGKALFRETAGGDTGRCIADNLIAGNDGAEMCGSHNSVVYSCTGDHAKICDWSNITKWGQNSVVYWSDVLERAVLDRTMADQYGKGRIFTGDGVTFNNYTKSNACLTADLFGDWREEMIFRKSDGGLRVFATTYSTEYPIYTLMQNPQYRVQVASQNNGYNQPPHTDYFLGTGFDLPVAPEIRTAK